MKPFIIACIAFSICPKKRRIVWSEKLGEKTNHHRITCTSYESNQKISNTCFTRWWIFIWTIFGALNYGAYWDDLPETIIVAINQNSPNTRVWPYWSNRSLPTKQGRDFEFIGELSLISKTNTEQFPFKMIHTILQQRLSIFYLYKENPLFNAYISKSRAGSRNGKSSC
jgi:hypothetical protein